MAETRQPTMREAMTQGLGRSFGEALPYILLSLFPKKQQGQKLAPEDAMLTNLRAQLLGRNLALGQAMDPLARGAIQNLQRAIPGAGDFPLKFPSGPIFEPGEPLGRNSAGSYYVDKNGVTPMSEKKKGGGFWGFLKGLAPIAANFIPIPGVGPLASTAIRAGIGAGAGALSGGKRGAVSGAAVSAVSPYVGKAIKKLPGRR